MSERNVCHKLSVVIARRQRAGSGVAELWSESSLLGILHQEDGGIVLRLESRARGPLAVSAVALERALAEARTRLAVAVEADPVGSRAEDSMTSAAGALRRGAARN